MIVLLRLGNFLPRLPNQFLCGAHVSVPLADVYRRFLRKHNSAEGKGGTERDGHHHNSLNHGFVPPGCGKSYNFKLARRIIRNFHSCRHSKYCQLERS